MGCSSSSAQTVEQEKRPGTKPEESNGDPVVRNGILTDEVPTIEDQMQLPVQNILVDDLKVAPEDEAEAVLMAMEAQEDLGSGEDLLIEPVASEEPTPRPASSEAVEKSFEPAAEVVPPVEEALPVETVTAEACPEVKALEPTEETSEAESADNRVVEEPVNEEASKAPTEDAELEQAETPTGNAAPETVSETPAAGEASTTTAVSVAIDEVPPSDPSGPVDAIEPVINTTIAAASVPEMPPVTAVSAEAEPESAAKEETEATSAPVVTASPAELSCAGEITAASEPAETSEAAPVGGNLESSTEAGVTPEVPNTAETEPPADLEPAPEPVPEPPPEASVNEASKDTVGEFAKKQD